MNALRREMPMIVAAVLVGVLITAVVGTFRAIPADAQPRASAPAAQCAGAALSNTKGP